MKEYIGVNITNERNCRIKIFSIQDFIFNKTSFKYILLKCLGTLGIFDKF